MSHKRRGRLRVVPTLQAVRAQDAVEKPYEDATVVHVVNITYRLRLCLFLKTSALEMECLQSRHMHHIIYYVFVELATMSNCNALVVCHFGQIAWY